MRPFRNLARKKSGGTTTKKFAEIPSASISQLPFNSGTDQHSSFSRKWRKADSPVPYQYWPLALGRVTMGSLGTMARISGLYQREAAWIYRDIEILFPDDGSHGQMTDGIRSALGRSVKTENFQSQSNRKWLLPTSTGTQPHSLSQLVSERVLFGYWQDLISDIVNRGDNVSHSQAVAVETRTQVNHLNPFIE